ncbi:tetratricopeptide repeat protein [Sediminitomix flava]|uniref:Tetratricopeptide repeat protein n=1 Tax=Sediminitomix flava TaxID=379075 RepID=A0A315Z9U1_SEDFL|nr:tetratricopeptide repeat protein [Sediminitomix flava]PWJ42345.1 tetratricopeptide repeat protein [Sediminitomix flava]
MKIYMYKGLSKGIGLLLILCCISFLLPESVIGQRRKKDKNVAKLGQNSLESEAVFIDAMGFYLLEDYKKALELFQKCDEMNWSAAATKYQIAMCYANLSNFESALAYSQKAVQLNPENKYYYLLLADVLKQRGDFLSASEVYAKAASKFQDGQELFYELADCYINIQQYQKAIAVYQDMEEKFGIDELLIKQKQRLYIGLDDLDAALMEGQKLIDAYPSIGEFKLAQIELYLRNKQTDKAKELIDIYLAEHADDGRARYLLAKIHRSRGEEKEYFEALKLSFQSSDLIESEKEAVLTSYLKTSYNEEQKEMGKELAQIAVETHPESGNLRAILGDFLLTDELYRDARTQYIESVANAPDNFKVWQQIIQIDWELNEVDSVIYHSEEAIEIFPNQVIFHFHNGSANNMNKNYDEAAESLEYAKVLAVDPQLQLQINSQLGDIYNFQKEYQKSDKAYEEALKYDPYNAYVLNNYSYFLSLRKERLDKAEEMSSRLVELEPENPTYLDTYGWVLYAKGKYEEALKVLEKVAPGSDNAEVVEHYGDVLYRVGRKDDALKQWKIALSLEGEHGDSLKKKIEEKKLIE